LRWAERQGVSAKQEVVETDEDTHTQNGRQREEGGDVKRANEEALRGEVERGEMRGVLAEMTAVRQRANPHHRSSDGTTRTGGGGGRGETQRNLEGDVSAPIRTNYRH
jgi:hypothetical protein